MQKKVVNKFHNGEDDLIACSNLDEPKRMLSVPETHKSNI